MCNLNGISVIVCCYNSASRLPETIKHIALQQVTDDIGWELIIVNNNSTDNTAAVALTEIQKYAYLPSRYKIVNEPNAGLSHARHTGVTVSKYEYTIFCDDDNWLDKNYLQTAYDILSSNEKIAAVGGESEAISDVTFPAWFDKYKQCYAVGKQKEEKGILNHYQSLWGAGLAFRKSLYLVAYKNHPSFLSDRNGNDLTSGGDYEICLRMQLMKFELLYCDELNLKHFITSNRLTKEYLGKLLIGINKSNEIITAYFVKVRTERLNFLGKIFLFFNALIKYMLSKFLVKRWNSAYENLIIFNLTGFAFREVTQIEREIKHLSF